MDSEVDVVVLGAGPAGLAAAVGAEEAGVAVLAIEAGRGAAQRRHETPEDLVSGVGGAGLFSDGKFSFFPSASALWRLPRRRDLEFAYSWYLALLSDAGLDLAGVSAVVPTSTINLETVDQKTVRKSYLSKYLDLDSRYRLIAQLAGTLGDRLVAGSEVFKTVVSESGVEVHYRATNGSVSRVRAKSLVLASGRFGPVTAPTLFPGIPMRYERVEVGLRLEQPAEDFFLRTAPELDPKFIRDLGDGFECRTFCCCRDGMVSPTTFGPFVSLSGRSDCDPTGRSNVGITVRATDPAVLEEPVEALLDRVEATPIRRSTLSSALEASSWLEDAYGQQFASKIRSGLRALLIQFSDLDPANASVVGPVIEGVGHYPATDEDLRIPGMPVWVAGDVSGRFRGITAAMVSGRYVGDSAANAVLDRSTRGAACRA